MNKILFMNCSPNKNGNTYRIKELMSYERSIYQIHIIYQNIRCA